VGVHRRPHAYHENADDQDAKLDVIGDFVVAIWNTLEDNEEDEEEG
jgi:hypothetical protein